MVDCDDGNDIIRMDSSRDRRAPEVQFRLMGFYDVHFVIGVRKARHC